MRKILACALLVCALVTTAACHKDKGGSTMAGDKAGEKSLFDRLGGMDGITKVVGDFVTNVAGDDRINKRFANTDVPHLKQMLIDQVCAATGGPCKYTGKDMKTAHAGMKISEDEFNFLVEDLVKALDANKVPEKEKGELLGALGGMKGDIVGQ